MAFSFIFPLTFVAYMLIYPREGKKRMGRRGQDHDGMRKEFGWRIGPDRGGGGSTAAESRARPVILIYSIHLVCFMIPSLQACLIPPVLTIFERNEFK